MTTKTAPAKAPSEALLLEIAAKHFFLETLETIRQEFQLLFRKLFGRNEDSVWQGDSDLHPTNSITTV